MNKHFVLFLIPLTFLFSCGNKAAETVSDGSEGFDTTVVETSSLDASNRPDSVHKFIRTADLKFRVSDAVDATSKIEDIVAQSGGFVTQTDLKSESGVENTEQISMDSSVISTDLTVINEMIIRVPNSKLDTVLRSILKLAKFIDYRTVKAEDVSLQLLSNNLTQKRSTRPVEVVTTKKTSSGKTTKETVTIKGNGDGATADNALVENLSLYDQLKYSTVNLYIYQRTVTRHEMIETPQNNGAYSPGFLYKTWDSIVDGWSVVSFLYYAILKLWGLALIGFVGIIVYKNYFKKK